MLAVMLMVLELELELSSLKLMALTAKFVDEYPYLEGLHPKWKRKGNK